VPADYHQGRAVQVEPIKPTLKAPGTKRLKQQYDELLSSFPFKLNLRRYTKQTGDITAFHVCVNPGVSGGGGEKQEGAAGAGAIGGVMSASKDGTVVEWAVEWSQDADGGGGGGGQGHTMQWKAGTLQGKRF
jgi:hypothetical protein